MDVNINEFYSIKEISEIVGFKPYVIRFYEKEFGLEIPRGESNRRMFSNKELEQLQYIKLLQEKGLSNKQIKNILKSPEIILGGRRADEAAAANLTQSIVKYQSDLNENYMQEMIEFFRIDFTEALKQLDYKSELEVLSSKLDELKQQLKCQEEDVLICENARLKMKLKEKSYEVAALKEKLLKEENKKRPFLQKLFGSKNREDKKKQ